MIHVFLIHLCSNHQLGSQCWAAGTTGHGGRCDDGVAARWGGPVQGGSCGARHQVAWGTGPVTFTPWAPTGLILAVGTIVTAEKAKCRRGGSWWGRREGAEEDQ